MEASIPALPSMHSTLEAQSSEQEEAPPSSLAVLDSPSITQLDSLIVKQNSLWAKVLTLLLASQVALSNPPLSNLAAVPESGWSLSSEVSKTDSAAPFAPQGQHSEFAPEPSASSRHMLENSPL